MFESKFFKITFGIILLLLIIFLAGQIPYIMEPVSAVFSLFLFPLLLGGFLYYLLRPLVRFFNKKVENKSLSILISMILVVVFISLIFYFGGSIIYTEIKGLTKYYSINYDLLIKNLNQLKDLGNNNQFGFINDLKIQERLVAFANKILAKLTTYNYVGIFSSITNFGMSIFLIPFVLYYFLKDDVKIFNFILDITSGEKRAKLEEIIREIDKALSVYISSQLLVALILGMYMFIAFLVIGLPNALALALIAMVTSLLPVIGPILGILPAFFVALSESYMLVIGVLVVLATAQYLEGNLIRPYIQGRKLEIHPLIVLFLVLISVYLFGFLGALFAVPVYVVIRIIVKNYYRLR